MNRKTYLFFCFEQFFQVQNNEYLTPQALASLINHVSTLKSFGYKGRHEVLSYLDQNFSKNFEPDYFKQKSKLLQDSCDGLNIFQRQHVKLLGLNNESIEEKIISIESAIVRHHPPQVDTYLQGINNIFLQLHQVLLPEDFDSLIGDLEQIRENIAKDYQSFEKFLSIIAKTRGIDSCKQIFIRNEIEKASSDLLSKSIVYMEDISILTANPDVKLNSLAIKELLSSIVLNSSQSDLRNKKEYVEKINRFLFEWNAIAIDYPHIRENLLECFNNIPDKESNDYIQHIEKLTDRLKTLTEFLSLSPQEINIEKNYLIYSLLAHFNKKPLELIELTDMVDKLPQDDKFFTLKFLSRLLDNHQSIEGADTLLNLLASDESKRVLFKQYITTPPYPDVKTLIAWFNQENWQNKHAEFTRKPYGKRKLDKNFAFEKYKIQRSKFEGDDVSALFTDDRGIDLENQLKVNRHKTMQKLLSDVQVHRKNESPDDNSKINLLCLLIEVLSRTASQRSYDSSYGPSISQECNTTQVMTLIATILNKKTHLINQVDTGEGKSRITMIMAAWSALQGKTVDCITSDLPLAERDYLSYKQFFTALGVSTSLLSLNTPPSMYQKNGVNFGDSQLILLRNLSDIESTPYAYLDEVEQKRCLLIDEVDKFIYDRSKDSYNYAAKSAKLSRYVWIYPCLVRFVQTIKLSNGFTIPSVELRTSFKRYIESNVINRLHKTSFNELFDQHPEQIDRWLQSAHTALLMEPEKDYLMSKDDNKSLFLERDSENHVRYTRKIFVLDNGRPMDKSTFSDGLHQCLCAKENIKLKNDKAFLIMPENETQRARFAVSFLSSYNDGSVYGLSGTTRSEAPRSSPDINYENFSYITTPRENLLIRQDKPTWLAKDEAQQITFIKRDVLKKLKQNLPVLLICKDDQQSSRIHEALQSDKAFMNVVKALQRVHGLTEKQDEIHSIDNAGKPGFLTLSTAGMLGRGVDIHAENLFVLCAYVATKEDEIQIKGRTGRAGKPGEFRAIVNKRDTDFPLNGSTYNIENEIVRSQKQRQYTSAFEKEVSSLYALFLEEVHQLFLSGCQEYAPNERQECLSKWQSFLGQIQNDWSNVRPSLLEAANNEDQNTYTSVFNKFTQKWLRKAPIATTSLNFGMQEENIRKTFNSLKAQKSFFSPQRQALRVARSYDVSDAGQARIYSSLFEQSRAILRGDRELFANFRAWKEGRGCMFPELRAVLNGERSLFANLIETIRRVLGHEPKSQTTDPAP